MKAKNHIIFNIFFVFLIKNIKFVYFTTIEWYILFFVSTIICLFPDIDHPNSFIGRKIKLVSTFLNKNFGHREITHSLLFLILIYQISKYFLEKKIFFSKSIYYGITIGYFTHILADIISKRGVSLLWPIKFKFKLKKINILYILIILIILIILNKIY